MQIHIISIGTKMPAWVNDGVNEYLKRMPRECRVGLIELAAAQRSKTTDLKRAVQDESDRLLKAVPRNCIVIALDVNGRQHNTESLSMEMGKWLSDGRDIALLIGGADGLSPECLSSTESKWSLSKLTYPHPLVRIILAEQLYRAWSLLNNHPYHRA
jgi:23S rRNA (pseudouridine1915-N3)-methyltransferase